MIDLRYRVNKIGLNLVPSAPTGQSNTTDLPVGPGKRTALKLFASSGFAFFGKFSF